MWHITKFVSCLVGLLDITSAIKEREMALQSRDVTLIGWEQGQNRLRTALSGRVADGEYWAGYSAARVYIKGEI